MLVHTARPEQRIARDRIAARVAGRATRCEAAAPPKPSPRQPALAGSAGTRGDQLGRALQRAVVARATNACPAYAPGEVQTSLHGGFLDPDVSVANGRVVIADFPIDRRSVRASAKRDPTLQNLVKTWEADEDYRLKIAGHTDCHGDRANHIHLRKGRAERVEELLGPKARSRVDSRGMAPLGTFLGANDTQEARARNRAVTIDVERNVNFEEETITGTDCKHPVKAADLSAYIELVMCAERATAYTPRQMLSFLRKLYYSGASWGRCGTSRACGLWGSVIPCGVDVGDPTKRMDAALLKALGDSQVVGGIDMGHIFTGLESMLCPSKQVELEIPGPNWEVAISNEDFATWAGDLGSAAAVKVYDEDDRGRAPKPWSQYFGRKGSLASEEDLTGDIDAFVVRAGLSGKSCGTTQGTTLPSLSQPMSALLHDLYKDSSSALGTARSNGIRCFVEAFGGVVSGGRIINRSEFTDRLTPRVFKFTDAYYRMKFHPFAGSSPGIGTALYIAASGVTREFVSFLEARL
jgi:outer membrane protein OmpA-like peptidoglycan-associated protein